MNEEDPHFTTRCEEALRLLVKRPGLAVKYLERRFGLDDGDVGRWLTMFNRGQKDLRGETIDAAKRGAGAAVVTSRRAPAVPVPDPQSPIPSGKEEAFGDPKRPAIAPAGAAVGPAADLGKWMEAEKGKIVGRCTTLLVDVTPALAARWLELNKANRIPSKAKIRRFAAAMKGKRWTVTGETIKFSSGGRLLDGQSRLMALVQAGVNAVLEIRSGLPEEAQKSMDIGELRKGTHTLEMMGEKYPTVLAPALKLIWLLEGGNLGGSKVGRDGILENFQLPEINAKHRDLQISVGWTMTTGSGMVRMLPPGLTAFFHYIFGRVDAELRDTFFEALHEGIGLTKLSPIYHLRERLLSDRHDGTARLNKNRLHRVLMIKAWNASRKSAKVSGLTWLDGEAFPEIDGLKL